jgi:REP element-mobilizing transposase RayT
LPGFDYAQAGWYFVTICVQGKACLLGAIVDAEMKPNAMGCIAAESWLWLAVRHKYIELDAWVVMPNHLHGIITLVDDDLGAGAPLAPGAGGSRTAPTMGLAKRKPLGRLVGAFKTVSTKAINDLRAAPGAPFWQKNYYEQIIRNQRQLDAIRRYIESNPANWSRDRLYLAP